MATTTLNKEVFLENTNKAKELLYKHYAPKMYGICLRFAGNQMEADDILQEAFIKIFVKIKDFRNEGSLEGWIRRTIINTAINFYRRNHKYATMNDLEGIEKSDTNYVNIYDKISHDDLIRLVNELPNGYRTVFNLNVIEGYTHKEIGKMLNISDNTSKSQLTRARTVLQNRIKSLLKEKVKIPFENFRVLRGGDAEIKFNNETYSKAV